VKARRLLPLLSAAAGGALGVVVTWVLALNGYG
jgi:hypothetical protein